MLPRIQDIIGSQAETLVSVNTHTCFNSKKKSFIPFPFFTFSVSGQLFCSNTTTANVCAKSPLFLHQKSSGKMKNHLSDGPNHLSCAPNHLSFAPNHLSDRPNHLSDGANHLSFCQNHLSDGAHHLSDGTNHLSCEPHHLSDGAHHLSYVPKDLCCGANHLSIFFNNNKIFVNSNSYIN